MEIKTPYYLIKESQILKNMEKMQFLKENSGCKVLLALKCFSTWSVFDLMSKYMDGTTSSSLNEVRLGKTKFGKEAHAYSVAYSENEINDVLSYADKIIFNSYSQLEKFKDNVSNTIPMGLRINPQISSSSFIIADPSRPYSRLGESNIDNIKKSLEFISGVMIHNNCENDSYEKFNEMLTKIENQYDFVLNNINWISLGGGIHFTGENYPIEKLANRLKEFSQKYDIQIYLEPGEASITKSATLETTVLDIIDNGKRNVIVDSSIEAHMLDLLIYRTSTSLYAINGQTINLNEDISDESTIFCGNSCLAGDIFGEFKINDNLKIGDRVSFGDAAGYTMVKKNWFNGVKMPSIVVERLNGDIELVKSFNYEDFENALS